tara:strand:+ start:2201 stop:2923 length:723 start_codon:yes stop_codon:yes gene_type:complete
LFIDRLAHLVRRDGLEGVAGSYGVRPATVVNWLRGNTTPSRRRMVSVSSRGRRISGPSRTTRNPTTGRFDGAIISGHAVKAINTINAERRANSEAGMAAATNDRIREMERARGLPLTREEELALDARMRRLNQRQALFGEMDGTQQDELNFDWRRFDRDYNSLSQGNSVEQEIIDEENLEEVTVIRETVRYLRQAYVVIRGQAKQVFIGSRGGYYYRSPSGYKVYVEAARVNEATRVVRE